MFLFAIMKYQTALFTDSKEAISPEETESIHSKYILLYENRISKVNKSSVNRSAPINLNSSFKPEICEKSKKINENVTIQEIQQKKHQKNAEKIKEIELKNLDECTFHPTILPYSPKLKNENVTSPVFKEYLQMASETIHRGQMLFSFSQIAKEKKEDFAKQFKEKIEENELFECTFQPNIETKGFEKKITKEDIKKTVERLAKPKKNNKIEKINKKINDKFEIHKKRIKSEEKKFKELKNLQKVTQTKTEKQLKNAKKPENRKKENFDRVWNNNEVNNIEDQMNPNNNIINTQFDSIITDANEEKLFEAFENLENRMTTNDSGFIKSEDLNEEVKILT